MAQYKTRDALLGYPGKEQPNGTLGPIIPLIAQTKYEWLSSPVLVEPWFCCEDGFIAAWHAMVAPRAMVGGARNPRLIHGSVHCAFIISSAAPALISYRRARQRSGDIQIQPENHHRRD